MRLNAGIIVAASVGSLLRVGSLLHVGSLLTDPKLAVESREIR